MGAKRERQLSADLLKGIDARVIGVLEPICSIGHKLHLCIRGFNQWKAKCIMDLSEEKGQCLCLSQEASSIHLFRYCWYIGLLWRCDVGDEA